MRNRSCRSEWPGKHNNWSITTDDGKNLLDPGKTPHENLQFLLVLTCVLKAVDDHAALLRESAADPVMITDWELMKHHRQLFPYSLANNLKMCWSRSLRLAQQHIV